MPLTGAFPSATQPHRHCALCPSPIFPQLAALPGLSELLVYPMTARRPQPSAVPPAAGTPGLPALSPPPAAAGADRAEALLLFFTQAPLLEATLAALPGIQFFDWTGQVYGERGAAALPRAASATGNETTPECEAADQRATQWIVPTPLYLHFAGLPGAVGCDLPAPLTLWQSLRLPAVRAVRASGGYRIPSIGPQGTPARGVSFARPTATPSAGMPIPSDAEAGQVGLRVTPAAAADNPTVQPSRALLVPLGRLPELTDWLLTTPPLRWQGLLFTVLTDALWIDNSAAAEVPLPPLLQADRLSPHAGSIGATLWLETGTAWTPPLATDLILERLQALPSCDYVLRPDLSGALRCRYVLERARVQPLDRATLHLAVAEISR